MTLREILANWLHGRYSRWPGEWTDVSEKSKRKWRDDAGDLLRLLGEDPDTARLPQLYKDPRTR